MINTDASFLSMTIQGGDASFDFLSLLLLYNPEICIKFMSNIFFCYILTLSLHLKKELLSMLFVVLYHSGEDNLTFIVPFLFGKR